MPSGGWLQAASDEGGCARISRRDGRTMIRSTLCEANLFVVSLSPYVIVILGLGGLLACLILAFKRLRGPQYIAAAFLVLNTAALALIAHAVIGRLLFSVE